MLGGFAEPIEGVGVGFGNAEAELIAKAQTVLPGGIALIRGFAKPVDGFGFIFGDSGAVLIAGANLDAGGEPVAVRRFAKAGKSFRRVGGDFDAVGVALAQQIEPRGPVLVGGGFPVVELAPEFFEGLSFRLGARRVDHLLGAGGDLGVVGGRGRLAE